MSTTRNTWQKQAVRDALHATGGFVSAQALHQRLVSTGQDLSLATVYRALASLVDSEQADTLLSAGEVHYRACSSGHHHHHLVCRTCGTTVELEAAEVETWAHKVAEKHGFADPSHHVEVFGTCGACAGSIGKSAETRVR